jgi:hypothetical protein
LGSLPDDILLIHYAGLSQEADQRVRLLTYIGTLLDKQPGYYSMEDLELTFSEWQNLYKWIEQGNGSLFWRAEEQKLHILQTCKKHLLVGTGQLLTDLKHVVLKSNNQLAEFDFLWSVARHYVSEEVVLELD